MFLLLQIDGLGSNFWRFLSLAFIITWKESIQINIQEK